MLQPSELALDGAAAAVERRSACYRASQERLACALIRSQSSPFWGATPEEAAAKFQEAVAKDAEIRARPDPWDEESS